MWNSIIWIEYLCLHEYEFLEDIDEELCHVGILNCSLYSSYNYIKSHIWNSCTSNLTGKAGIDCSIKNKPSVSAIQLSLFCYFGFGMLLSSWLWKMAAFKSWKHFLMRLDVSLFSDMKLLLESILSTLIVYYYHCVLLSMSLYNIYQHKDCYVLIFKFNVEYTILIYYI